MDKFTIVLLSLIFLPFLLTLLCSTCIYIKLKNKIKKIEIYYLKKELLSSFEIYNEYKEHLCFLLYLLMPIANIIIFTILVIILIEEKFIKKTNITNELIDDYKEIIIERDFELFKKYYYYENTTSLKEKEITTMLLKSKHNYLLQNIFFQLIPLLKEYDDKNAIEKDIHNKTLDNINQSIANFISLVDKIQSYEENNDILNLSFNHFNQLVENIIFDIDKQKAVFVNT